MGLISSKNKTKYRLILLLLGLSLYGCGQINDSFFESRSTETTRVKGREVFNASKGLKVNESISATYDNEYDKGNVYPSGTSQFYGERDETGTIKGTDYYDDGSEKTGVVMPGQRLWNIQTNEQEE